MIALLLLSRSIEGASLHRWLDPTCGTGGDTSRIGGRCTMMEATFCLQAGSSSVRYHCDDDGIMTKNEFKETQSCGLDLPESCGSLPLPCVAQSDAESLIIYNNTGYQDQCIYFGPEDYRVFSCGPCAAFAAKINVLLSVGAFLVATCGPSWF
jgi:hypothetical protein